MNAALLAMLHCASVQENIQNGCLVCKSWNHGISNFKFWRDKCKLFYGLEEDIETEWKVLAVYLDRSYRGSYSRICELSEYSIKLVVDVGSGWLVKHYVPDGRWTAQMQLIRETAYWTKIHTAVMAIQAALHGNERKWNKLEKVAKYAQWNEKYFKILDKPFQQLVFGDFKTMVCVLPSVLKTLQQVWKLNRYYQNRNRMQQLLVRIRIVLQSRIIEAFHLSTLLQDPENEAHMLNLEMASILLHKWHDVAEPSTTWGPFESSIVLQDIDYISERLCEIRAVLRSCNKVISDGNSVNMEKTECDTPRLQLMDALTPKHSVFTFSSCAINVFDPQDGPVWCSSLSQFHDAVSALLLKMYKMKTKSS